MVNDLVVAAELWELVPDLMKAVRTARDDREHLVAVQRLDRVLREHLVEVLVSHAPGGVAMAMLFLAENREANAAGLEDASEGYGDFLGAIIEGAHAPDPEQDVRTLPALVQLRHRGDVEAIRPARAIGLRERPRRAVALERLERGLHLRGKPRLAQHEVAAHLVDDVELIDRDGTLLHARATAGAGPELFFRDVLVEQA